MRPPRKLQPRLEMMESKLLLSGDSLGAATIAHHVAHPATTPPPIHADGELTGTFAVHFNKIPDTGMTYELGRSAKVNPRDNVTLKDPSDIFTPGNIAMGQAHGTLTVSYTVGSNKTKHTLTLELTALQPQKGLSHLPDHSQFHYVVTGAKHKTMDSGTLTLDLKRTQPANPNSSGTFAIHFESSGKK